MVILLTGSVLFLVLVFISRQRITAAQVGLSEADQRIVNMVPNGFIPAEFFCAMIWTAIYLIAIKTTYLGGPYARMSAVSLYLLACFITQLVFRSRSWFKLQLLGVEALYLRRYAVSLVVYLLASAVS